MTGTTQLASTPADEELVDLRLGEVVDDLRRRAVRHDAGFRETGDALVDVVIGGKKVRPALIFAYAAFEAGSFYDFLALHDALPSRAHERVFAGSLSEVDADALGAPAGGAALVRVRTSYLADGSPIEYTRHTSFSDRYQMDIDLEMHA